MQEQVPHPRISNAQWCSGSAEVFRPRQLDATVVTACFRIPARSSRSSLPTVAVGNELEVPVTSTWDYREIGKCEPDDTIGDAAPLQGLAGS
jgi:hypothetical protein